MTAIPLKLRLRTAGVRKCVCSDKQFDDTYNSTKLDAHGLPSAQIS